MQRSHLQAPAMALPLTLSHPLAFPIPSLFSWKTFPLQPRFLPSLRLFPSSFASLDKSWAHPSTWKFQRDCLAGKHRFPLAPSPRLHVVESSTFTLQLGCTQRDTICTVVAFAGSFLWIRFFDILVQNKLLEQKLSRKLMHISTGILYALVWPMYSTSPWSRFFALAIPLATVLKLLLYGLSILKDEGLVKSISREGTAKELLRGPLYYVLVLSLCTVIFWRESPVGTIALAIMCGGDGIADIVGRRMGGVKLPYNRQKSWAGSIAMFLFGFVLSIGFLYYYSSLGFYRLDWGKAVQTVALISFVATVVESLPISSKLDDNLSVPLVSVLLGAALFPSTIL